MAVSADRELPQPTGRLRSRGTWLFPPKLTEHRLWRRGEADTDAGLSRFRLYAFLLNSAPDTWGFFLPRETIVVGTVGGRRSRHMALDHMQEAPVAATNSVAKQHVEDVP
jgi:hypothetical protein